MFYAPAAGGDMRNGLWCVVLTAGCAAKIDQAQIDAVTGLTGDPTHGATVFKDNCVDCHGDDGTKEKSADLTVDVPKDSEDDLVEKVLSGPWIMPNFVNKLSNQDVADVVAYLDATWGPSAS